jgi:thiol peroxidase
MSIERAGGTTTRGNPMTLVGPELKAGDPAPDFTAVGVDMKPVSLGDSAGKVRIIISIPSVDTPVCDREARHFNEEAASLGDIQILTVSTDLPFAQKRWCAAAGVEKLKMLSDHRDTSFGTAYGTLIKELRIESRAVFVVDQSGTLRYVEYVPEVADEPNYASALEAAKKLGN